MRCSNCNKENPPAETYCFSCGYLLRAVPPQAPTPTPPVLNEETSPANPKRRWGTARFDSHTILIIIIKDYDNKPIRMDLNHERILGRSHNDYHPDIDLTPFDGYDRGVSRQHASIRLQTDTVMLVDLNSANHTFLNGQRLIPDQPRIVRDGDEIRLGQLVLRVNFEDMIKPPVAE